MPIEIERKFLVRSTEWRTGAGTRLVQGYLNRDPQRTVRVRIAGPAAFLTIKGRLEGPARPEFEYSIPLDEAQQLLTLCEGPLIDKVRYEVQCADVLWEIDEFHGQNAGLVVAEVELDSADQEFQRPDWLGAEVTDDPRYFNSYLAKHPYGTWGR